MVDKAQADWAVELAGWSLNAVAAHSILHDAFDIDLDFTPSPASIAHAKVSTPTTTFELGLSPYFKGFYGVERLFGLSLGQSQVLAGFFYQRRELNHLAIDYRFRLIPFARLTAAAAVGTAVTLPGLPTLPGIDERFEETVTQGFDQTALRAAVHFLRAPRGILNDSPLYAEERIEPWARRIGRFSATTIPDVNHYTILLAERGARAVAAEVRALLGS